MAKALEAPGSPIAEIGDLVFGAIAAELQQQTTIDMTDVTALRRVLDSSAALTGTALLDELKQAIAQLASVSSSEDRVTPEENRLTQAVDQLLEMKHFSTR